MKDANPRAHINRMIQEGNFLGAYLYLKDAGLERDEHVELLGLLATSVSDELSRTRRDDKERIYFLRSILAWILKDVPGLSALYREQLREQRPGTDFLSSFARGWRNFGDVASGRKSVSDGFQDASEDARRNFEDAAESMRSGEARDRVTEFFTSAEKGLRQGIDQLSDLFRSLNDQYASQDDSSGGKEDDDPTGTDRAAASAAKADADGDIEDADFSDANDAQDIHVDRE